MTQGQSDGIGSRSQSYDRKRMARPFKGFWIVRCVAPPVERMGRAGLRGEAAIFQGSKTREDIGLLVATADAEAGGLFRIEIDDCGGAENDLALARRRGRGNR